MPKSYDAVVGDFISALFNARTNAHIMHLQTDSYAEHKALEGFYFDIVLAADRYVELYQGRYGKVSTYTTGTLSNDNAVPFFRDLAEELAGLEGELPDDLDLENAYADVMALVHRTQYLLTLA